MRRKAGRTRQREVGGEVMGEVMAGRREEREEVERRGGEEGEGRLTDPLDVSRKGRHVDIVRRRSQADEGSSDQVVV
eukprot:766349-Hanusia_phi.AAC.3